VKVYVAGASREPERVRRWMDMLRGAGHEITHDWLAAMEAAPAPDHLMSTTALLPYALADQAAVLEADVVWVLAPEAPSTGCWVELGMALQAGRRVVVSGPGARRCIFSAMARVMATDAEAFELVTDRWENG
jgi:hypothetical protein